MWISHIVMKMKITTLVHTIDHFLVLEHSEKVVVDAGVIHNVDNTSDHEPIYSVIEAPKLGHKETNDDEEKGTPKFDWKNASDDQKLEFNDELSEGSCHGYSDTRLCSELWTVEV